MADVFISYSKQDRQSTAKLAEELGARGIEVWWDTDLLAGEAFQQKLRTELSGAKAIIVIWTKGSIGSPWVQWEAGFASALNKLITLKTNDIETSSIPGPHQQLHSINCSDMPAVLRALEHYDVKFTRSRDDKVAALFPDKSKALSFSKFLNACESERFWVDNKEHLMIKFRTSQRRDMNFAVIDPIKGIVDTGYVPYHARLEGRLEIAETYLAGLAQLIGGNVKREANGDPLRLISADGSSPTIEQLLDHSQRWLELLVGARDALQANASSDVPK